MYNSKEQNKIHNVPSVDITTFGTRNKYIHHRSPIISDYSRWYHSYEPYLIQMYILTQNIIKSRYPNINIIIESNTLFNIFSKIIYHVSSKHIDKNLNEPKEYLKI